jgi:hypothetical protein
MVIGGGEMRPRLLAALVAGLSVAPAYAQQAAPPAASLFRTSDACIACHNGLTAPSGEDVSIGADWRPTMMANSARDPYWQAGVRREVTDHPEAAAAIEHECSACHMPATRYAARIAGRKGPVFAHLPVAAASTADARLAADGVSCTVCHQITPEKLGTRESFTAGFVVDTKAAPGQRRVFGPFDIGAGNAGVMRSASSFTPATGNHVQSSEMCATCHTLYTHALGPGGQVVGELPEQVPYLEWRHSAYREEKSCQACHMPVVSDPVPIASVLGEPRHGFSRHEFRGSNFFMPRLLNRHAADLGVAALPQELDGSARRTIEYLAGEAATLSIDRVAVEGGRLVGEVTIANLGGHKLPTAYPSRRSWLRLAVRDARGAVIFESGAFERDGRIRGNDNDANAAAFEPHHAEITAEDQVQVYEAILGDPAGRVTTGLLAAVRYLKDNRLLPRGFDKRTADDDIAVRGEASRDEDFVGGGDRVRFAADLKDAQGPYRVEAELWYQPVGYRWARNLRDVKAAETDRFVRYYDEAAGASAALLAKAAATTR